MAVRFPTILEAPTGWTPAWRAPVAELRAAAALLATLARQVETATTWAEQRKALEALEAIPAARDALEAAAARLAPPPPSQRRPTRCPDCHRTEAEAHERWCPHA